LQLLHMHGCFSLFNPTRLDPLTDLPVAESGHSEHIPDAALAERLLNCESVAKIRVSDVYLCLRYFILAASQGM
jgi:hypothetical protein